MSREFNGKTFPLSLSQLNILNLERTLAGTSVNNISTTVRISGRVDFPALQKSINLVLESDPSLRTRLAEKDGEVLQYHADYAHEEFPVYDFSNTSKEGIENWENAVTRELIPLFSGPLYRFILFRDSESGGGVLVKLHHIIADGWSQIMLCNKIGKTYLDVLAGEDPELPETPDYELHVKEEEDYLASKAFKKDERYWKEILSHAGEPSVLKAVKGAAVSPVGRRQSFELPEIINHAIYSYCMEKRVAPFAVFYMALAIYFKRSGGADNFTIGVPIFNRTNYEFKQSTGMFVTTLPFCNEIDDEWTLNDFNDSLAERWFEMLRHQRYPFSKICELAGREGRLFNIALSYQDSKIFESRDASVSFSGRWHYCGYQAEQLTIHLTNLKNHRRYAVDYDYLAQFFAEDEIAALHKSLCHILAEALAEPDKPIYKLNVLSLDEKEKLLYTFNNTDRYLTERSVYSALIDNNSRHLNRAAIIHNGERMTYGSLFYKATQYASALSEIDSEGEKLAAVLLPRRFELPAAMVGSLQAGYAFMLLSQSLPEERIRKILEQSNASVLITDADGALRLKDAGIPMILAEDTDRRPAVLYKNAPEEVDGDKLAYVVYTSGSTGEPKGVEVTERNLLNLAQEMESVYGQGAVLSVCNVGFDAFMLESIVALLCGRTIVFPEESELEDPERLAALMNGFAVGYFSLTPSRLSAYLQNPIFRKVMWRMESIVCGGEHFPTELLKKLKSCTQARIYNQYGPSETAVAVSMKELSRAEKITVGSPMGNCKLYVLDRWMNPLPVGGHGRLFVGGKCVGRGYRGRPELTDAAFRPNPFISDDRIYDTGDIAYWTPNGEVVLTGRADRQVKLRGLRIELSEVSACIESFPGVTAAYAKICDVGSSQVIGVYYTAEREIGDGELLAHTATYLPEYMIPAFLMQLSSLAMTANGKIDESRLPLPQNPTCECGDVTAACEKVLVIFRRVLENDEVYANSDYFLCGGNSLNALECIMGIEEDFGKKIRVADLYACRTAARLSKLLDGGSSEILSRARVEKKKKQTEYQLTPIQQGIYVQTVLDPAGLTYNMPGAFMLENAPDTARLEEAFRTLIGEDAIFRTVFVQGSTGICARVLDKVDFELETISAESYEEACEIFLRPFDLTRAPLLRAALWQSPAGEYCLFIDSHHIIGDGISTPIVLSRLDRAYAGKPSAPEFDYYDYIESTKDSEDNSNELEYWADRLKEMPEPLALPTDAPRPARFDYNGDECTCALTHSDSRAIEAYCRENGYSEYVLFLAAYALLLSAVSGKEDMIVGTPVAGRDTAGTSSICGPFINTLPLRLAPKKELTVSEWLKSVRTEVAGMLDHQRVSLEDIISSLGLGRGEQNALYSVMLTQSPVDENGFMLDGGKMTFKSVPTGRVKMDMILELAKKEEQYLLRFSYAKTLFESETVSFWGRCITQALREMIKDSSRRLSDISLLTPADKEKYFDAPNYSVTPFIDRPVHMMLKSRAEADPDEVAVIWHGEQMTFAELERRANAIARFIEQNGVEAGRCVALCLSRTPDMIAAMYGVLKAGCAYMFMLESFPEARLRYMLEISDAGMLLYDSLPEALLADTPCPAFQLPAGECESYDDRAVSDDMLANVLFTSGSTGKPKGVMLRHRSVSNLTAQMKTLLAPIEGRVLCSTNSVFDCFIVETVIALALGRTVVLADEEEMMLPWKLGALVETYRTSVFEMTPARLTLCLGNEAFCRAAKHIGIVLLGGEVVTPALRDKFYEHSSGKLMNMYGPTEATVFTTMGLIEPGKHITVGSPLQNTRTYVLGEDGKPVLPTAVGELYIAGECVSAGYISRPELTGASYFDDILFPGKKMYKSGDLVRRRLDGRFDYIGRKDAQVKLNGQRVELTEITGAIEQTGLVRQAATVAVRKSDSTMELCAFAVGARPDVTEADIISGIKPILPEYMIPSRFIMLGGLPVTATNKIDMQTLRAMASEEGVPAPVPAPVCEKESAPAPVAGTDPMTEYVLSVWNKVLTVPATDPDLSFFSQGGSSMAALSVLSFYFNDGYEIALQDFYRAPTAREQALLLASGTSAQKSEPAEEEKPQKKAELRDARILLSGSTGFFGIHLLRELIESGEDRVACLMRDGSRERMDKYLEYYFGTDAKELSAHVEIIRGNIEDAMLGMTAEDYDALAGRIEKVFHAAADVRHYTSDEESYMKTNVVGTENMLNFSKAANASFYHISTCSISGEAMKDKSRGVKFTENDYDIGQVWENNVYIKSKFLAEGLVFMAKKEGLDAKIFRLGRLCGRASDGKFQINPSTNAFYLFMKGFSQIGALPEDAADVKLDVMPIDLCAKEVLALSETDGGVFHIMNPDPPGFGEIMQAVNEECLIVNNLQFGDIFRENCRKLDSGLLGFIMNNWRLIGSQQHAVEVTNEKTVEALKKAGFVPPAFSLETVLKEFGKGE